MAWVGLARHRPLVAFAAASVLSVPLVGPLGTDWWETWAWVGAAVAGSVPLLAITWPRPSANSG